MCTGDIEDAPGLDSLWSFSATVRDGKIVVKADEKQVNSKTGRIVPRDRTGKEPTKETVVIVGGGSGGIHTTESLRMVSLNCHRRMRGSRTDVSPEWISREYRDDLGRGVCAV